MTRTLSISATKLFMQCSAAYKFRYIDRIAVPMTSALALGRAIHGAVEFAFRAMLSGTVLPIEAAQEAAREDLDACEAEGLRLKDTETLDGLKDWATRAVETYLAAVPKDWRPVAVEETFQVPIVHPATGECLDCDLTGKLDLVLDDWAVVDHKTAKRLDPDEIDRSIQFSAYHYAKAVQGKEPPKFVVGTIVKNKTPKAEFVETRRTWQDHAFLFRVIEGVSKTLGAIEAGHAPFAPHPGTACRWCDFRAHCDASARRDACE